jgi:nitronate monooxygenase/enoyl-[acyl-carrier protein] reductase II
MMAQGVEAGDHVRGETTLALIPEVRDANGGYAVDRGRGDRRWTLLAAVLALGADGAVFGLRFLASNEALAHPLYRQRVIEANARDTLHTTLFDIGWPDARHRVLRNRLVDRWEAAGRPPSPHLDADPGEMIAEARRADVNLPPLADYTVMPPTD